LDELELPLPESLSVAHDTGHGFSGEANGRPLVTGEWRIQGLKRGIGMRTSPLGRQMDREGRVPPDSADLRSGETPEPQIHTFSSLAFCLTIGRRSVSKRCRWRATKEG
jgi:hypothetical protein